MIDEPSPVIIDSLAHRSNGHASYTEISALSSDIALVPDSEVVDPLLAALADPSFEEDLAPEEQELFRFLITGEQSGADCIKTVEGAVKALRPDYFPGSWISVFKVRLKNVEGWLAGQQLTVAEEKTDRSVANARYRIAPLPPRPIDHESELLAMLEDSEWHLLQESVADPDTIADIAVLWDQQAALESQRRDRIEAAEALVLSGHQGKNLDTAAQTMSQGTQSPTVFLSIYENNAAIAKKAIPYGPSDETLAAYRQATEALLFDRLDDAKPAAATDQTPMSAEVSLLDLLEQTRPSQIAQTTYSQEYEQFAALRAASEELLMSVYDKPTWPVVFHHRSPEAINAEETELLRWLSRTEADLLALTENLPDHTADFIALWDAQIKAETYWREHRDRPFPPEEIPPTAEPQTEVAQGSVTRPDEQAAATEAVSAEIRRAVVRPAFYQSLPPRLRPIVDALHNTDEHHRLLSDALLVKIYGNAGKQTRQRFGIYLTELRSAISAAKEDLAIISRRTIAVKFDYYMENPSRRSGPSAGIRDEHMPTTAPIRSRYSASPTTNPAIETRTIGDDPDDVAEAVDKFADKHTDALADLIADRVAQGEPIDDDTDLLEPEVDGEDYTGADEEPEEQTDDLTARPKQTSTVHSPRPQILGRQISVETSYVAPKPRANSGDTPYYEPALPLNNAYYARRRATPVLSEQEQRDQTYRLLSARVAETIAPLFAMSQLTDLPAEVCARGGTLYTSTHAWLQDARHREPLIDARKSNLTMEDMNALFTNDAASYLETLTHGMERQQREEMKLRVIKGAVFHAFAQLDRAPRLQRQQDDIIAMYARELQAIFETKEAAADYIMNHYVKIRKAKLAARYGTTSSTTKGQ